MSDRGQVVLERMLDRLFAVIARGPSINCRPHNSRQRLDLTELAALEDLTPPEIISGLLGPAASARLAARAPRPAQVEDGGGVSRPSAPGITRSAAPFEPIESKPGQDSGEVSTPAQAQQNRDTQRWERQQSVLRKLRHIAEEARTYEEDTGVYVLHVGYPLLRIPRGLPAAGGNRQVLAPLAFIPVTLAVSTGARASAELSCRYAGEERVVPNDALLGWIEQQTGRRVDDLFNDETGEDPWREVGELTRRIAAALDIEAPAWLDALRGDAAPSDASTATMIELIAAPKADEGGNAPEIAPAAVLGLYPISNQGLLRDTQSMIAEGIPSGPIHSFLSVDASLSPAEPDRPAEDIERRLRRFDEERFVQRADPCQARAVRLARKAAGLVIHGPPGTGKSQTITNIIADHLARGERVLFVCDKRTALDVVAHRLEHVGLGSLCAVVHDAQRDQRDLYMSVRGQLEGLADSHPKPRADRRIEQIDDELQRLHGELLEVWRSVMLDPESSADRGVPDADRAGGEDSFHDLVGRWLGIEVDPSIALASGALADMGPDELRGCEVDVRDVLERAREVEFASNPWVDAAGLGLDELLHTSGETLRSRLGACLRASEAADQSIAPGLPPLDPGCALEEQAEGSRRLADELESVMQRVPATIRQRWADAPRGDAARAWSALEPVRESAELLRQSQPDPEIDLVLRTTPLVPTALASDLASLARYSASASRWWSFAAFGAKRRGREVVARFGLPLSPESAGRVDRALRAARAELIVAAALDQAGATDGQGASGRADLLAAFDRHAAALALLARADGMATTGDTGAMVREAMRGTAPAEAAIAGLRAAPKRVAALSSLFGAISSTGLFRPEWADSVRLEACRHKPLRPLFQALTDRFGALEAILRVNDMAASLPAPLAVGVQRLLAAEAGPEEGWAALRRAHLEAEISRRLSGNPTLQRLDGRRIESALARIAILQHEKMDLVRSAVASRWVTTQRERLLAATGSRLNSMGAELKRRLLTRGRRAMRLRQVVQHGRGIEGGDPLFDLRPAWMASPETVAQVFPREQMFDLVIFDEASQCRLEEALPVLTRGRRVVVAGDPKQLPPTRFFESAVVASEDDEIQTDQDLFEAQQSGIEDLLGAALSIEIEQSHLDVHYRSRNADLIEFSNGQFYSSRLQAIPGHPKNRTRFAPLSLIPVRGVYRDGQNPIEAERVVQIVHDLLRRANPPSIGVACFNVVQRDLILDHLDDAAESDPTFGRQLAQARVRRGDGSFEGLFVKNLENVQGDERDHIIISTTYGPDPSGRFYRRFGPLLRPGGGRRLNVLVTRAREEVHLVTSIPPEHYRALPPVPEGQAPGGAWLLFSYLQYAERLGEAYEEAHAERERSRGAPVPAARRRPGAHDSAFSLALAMRLARAGMGNEVSWGNDGFCVDIAVDHPVRPDDVTIGVLTDMTRFRGAADPVEWELFRAEILHSQGWELHRAWAPAVFRDVVGVEASIGESVRRHLSTDEDPEAIRTWTP